MASVMLCGDLFGLWLPIQMCYQLEEHKKLHVEMQAIEF